MPPRKPSSERFARTTNSAIDTPAKPMSLRLPSRTEKRVSFHTITISEHAYELGNNPSVSDGAPLCIAWDAQYQACYDIKAYEIMNPSYQRRRAKHGLRLSVTDRAQM